MKSFWRLFSFNPFLVLAIALPGVSWAQSDTLKSRLESRQAPSRVEDYFSGGVSDRGFIYITPNEPNPELARHILEQASEGVHLSVGAERSLFGMALTENASHLVAMDVVPEVVLYNQINFLLLKIAQSRQHYLVLRETSEPSDWLSAMDAAILTSSEKSLLLNPENFEFFSHARVSASERMANPSFFIGSNYLKSDSLFARLSFLAKEDRLIAIKGNLLDKQALSNLAHQLSLAQLKFSVIDISNAWEPQYVGPSGVEVLLSELQEGLTAQTILLTSHFNRRLGENLYEWDYLGATVKSLRALREAAPSPLTYLSFLSQWRDLEVASYYDLDSPSKRVKRAIEKMNLQLHRLSRLEQHYFLKELYQRLSGLSNKLPGGNQVFYRSSPSTGTASAMGCRAVFLQE